MIKTPRIHETVIVKDRVRKVTDIIDGDKGQPVVIWKHKNDVGACTPGVWNDWKRDYKEDECRGCPRSRMCRRCPRRVFLEAKVANKK